MATETIRTIHKTDTTVVVSIPNVVDQQFGAGHVYEVRTISGYGPDGKEQKAEVLATINFQKGPIKENGINGVQHIDLLAIIRDRLDSFQAGPFASPANEVTAGFVAAAIASDETRTRRRVKAGTEGTSLGARDNGDSARKSPSAS